ncbi:hypothetical protein Tco_0090547 [Tanacetum coccineum]
MTMEILPESTSNKLCGRYKRRCCSLIPTESDSLPHAHAQTTKTYYKHQDSRIKKAQELKIKTSTTLIFKIFLKDINIIKIKIVKGNCWKAFMMIQKLSKGEEDLETLEFLAVKYSSNKGLNRKSNSCSDRVFASAEGETFGTSDELEVSLLWS